MQRHPLEQRFPNQSLQMHSGLYLWSLQPSFQVVHIFAVSWLWEQKYGLPEGP